MAAFDSLPRSVRRALSDAIYSWPAHEMAQRLAGGWSEAEVRDLIGQLDAERRRG